MANLLKTFLFIYLVSNSAEGKPSTNILKEIVSGDLYATDTMPTSQAKQGDPQDQAVSSLDDTDQHGLQPDSDTVESLTKVSSSDRKGKFLGLIAATIGAGYLTVLDALGIIKLKKNDSKIIETLPESQQTNQTTPEPKGPVPAK